MVIAMYLMQYILVESIVMDEVQARRLAFWPWFVVAFLSVTIETTVLGYPALVPLGRSRTHLGGVVEAR